ncbi:carbohydrate esterase, putative [Phytophthora infestans T30-4]|uniref:Carbohydrate esterase, putative n=1 Tax=Phytophthora infestans (strain T30-4) TaxID=403677 RepID=D0MXV6_PHYIT|nr:carbohydrate esterase, putative [Phytophthora infestans T30-4]EEY66004.1 carbohydrate esterase, putative [Phytophthora infestans T30-4]|eukprot:XP_002906603.1 carbohydrate esterase, putative [Phytophthora infestans T30-4]
MQFKSVASTLLVATAFIASIPQIKAESICTLSDSEMCAVDTLTPSDDDGSVLIYPGGNTRCAFDDYTDSATTFSTNSTYFFQVFPNGGSDKSKLMIFFQGGGACTDEDTCSFGLQCSLGASATLSTVATSSSAGVLNHSISDNTFKDWNIVFVPYCTGDVHAGNRILEPYESSIAEALGEPQCLGLNYTMYLNGYNNTQAALDWALENYPDVENLIVGGESAGSLGAQLHSAHIAELWSVSAKGTRFSVIADSYVGAVPANHTGSQSLHFTGVCDVNLGMPATVMAKCDAETATTGDLTQRYFYALLEEDIEGYPLTDQVSEENFYADMSLILETYQSISARSTTFYVEGTKHVFLADMNFTTYESDEGLMLGDVLNAWLVSDSSLNTNSGSTEASTTSTTNTTPTASITSTLTTSTTPFC